MRFSLRKLVIAEFAGPFVQYQPVDEMFFLLTYRLEIDDTEPALIGVSLVSANWGTSE